MPHIVLTEEQAKVIAEAKGPVDVHNPKGQVLAFLQPLDANEVEAVLRFRRRKASAAPEPGIPSARVQAMLRKLEEIDQREGITPEKVQEVLRRVRAGEEL